MKIFRKVNIRILRKFMFKNDIYFIYYKLIFRILQWAQIFTKMISPSTPFLIDLI